MVPFLHWLAWSYFGHMKWTGPKLSTQDAELVRRWLWLQPIFLIFLASNNIFHLLILLFSFLEHLLNSISHEWKVLRMRSSGVRFCFNILLTRRLWIRHWNTCFLMWKVNIIILKKVAHRIVRANRKTTWNCFINCKLLVTYKTALIMATVLSILFWSKIWHFIW